MAGFATHVPPHAMTAGSARYSARLSAFTPPVGMNLFVLQGVSPESTMTQIVKGVVPFGIAMAVEIFILCFFPQLATWLPTVIK